VISICKKNGGLLFRETVKQFGVSHYGRVPGVFSKFYRQIRENLYIFEIFNKLGGTVSE